MRFDQKSGRRLDHETASLYYETLGPPDGYPLVLLHGGLGSMADFNGVLPLLPQDYRFIGIDLRGQGGSTLGAQPLSYTQYARDARAILHHLRISRYTLIGFSDGGIAGYHLALQAEGGPEKLITLGAACRPPQGEARAMMSGMTAMMWAEMFPQSVQHYQNQNPAADLAALVKAVKALWLDDEGYPGNAIGAIRVPTLVLRGDTDALFSLEEAIEVRNLVQGAGLGNIPFADHDAHENAPDIFAAMVRRFVGNN